MLDELRAGEARYPPLADVRNLDWLESVACDEPDELRAFAHYALVLGSGQRDVGEALVLAWTEVNGGIAIIDERAGTQAAQARGIDVHGTLWLIVNGLRDGELARVEAEHLVDRLKAADARLSCSALALNTGDLFTFIGASQPDEWDRLVTAYGDPGEAQRGFARRLAGAIDDDGALDVLRHGVKDRGVTIRLAYEGSAGEIPLVRQALAGSRAVDPRTISLTHQ